MLRENKKNEVYKVYVIFNNTHFLSVIMSGIFVVIGSRRGTGLEVAKCLCSLPTSEIKEVRAVVRDEKTVPEELRQTRAKVVVADCTQPTSLNQVIEGAQVVFICASGASTLKNYVEVDELGPKNVAEIAKKNGVNRVVLVSSQLTHPSNFWNPVRILLNTLVSGWAKKVHLCIVDFILIRLPYQFFPNIKSLEFNGLQICWRTAPT